MKIAGIALLPHQHAFVLAVMAPVMSQAGENGQVQDGQIPRHTPTAHLSFLPVEKG